MDNARISTSATRRQQQSRPKKEAVEASRQARKREHICALEAYHNGKLTGIYQKDGKWQVYIHYNGERRYIGTYRALDLAIDAHTQALRHKVEGDFEEWLAKRKKGAKNDIS